MQTVTNALVPSKEELTIYQTIAQTAMESKYFDKLGGPAGVLSIMLYAREIGVSPMMALMGGFSNVQGKITMSAELIGTLIRRDGHKLEILESTNAICRIKGTRSDTSESYISSFTIEEARAASLIRAGGGWEKYPSDMLFARCISRLRRRLFSDIATKSYVEGEIEEEKSVREEKIVVIPAEEMKNETLLVKEYLTSEQIEEISDMIGEDVELGNRILMGYKVDRLVEIEAKHYKAIIKNLKARLEKAVV